MSNKKTYAFVRLNTGNWKKAEVLEVADDIATVKVSKDTNLKFNTKDKETFENMVTSNQEFSVQSLKEAVSPELFAQISKDQTQFTAEGKVKSYGMRDHLLKGHMQDLVRQYKDKDGVQGLIRNKVFLSGYRSPDLKMVSERKKTLTMDDVKYMGKGLTKDEFSKMKDRGFVQITRKDKNDKEFNRHVVYLKDYKNYAVIAPLYEGSKKLFAGARLTKDQIKSLNEGKVITAEDVKGVKKVISYNPQDTWRIKSQEVLNDLNKGKGNNKIADMEVKEEVVVKAEEKAKTTRKTKAPSKSKAASKSKAVAKDEGVEIG